MMSIQDHKGNTYRSARDMCRKYSLKYDVYVARMRRGWCLKDALETPVLQHGYKLSQRKLDQNYSGVQDHNGNHYTSVSAMCKHYGISRTTYITRLEKGMSLEEALTSPTLTHKKWVDHKGNVFNSKREMCEYWGITESLYRGRADNNWTIKEILTKPVFQKGMSTKGKRCQDHLGNTFSSVKEMCAFYHISTHMYHCRLRNGWSLEESLTLPAMERGSRRQTNK